MRKLTPVEKQMLSQSRSEIMIAKAAICLWFGLNTHKGSKELMGTGLYREVVRSVPDETGLSFLQTCYEEQMLVCGKGLFNWWADTLWVPCTPRPQFFSKVMNVAKNSGTESIGPP